MVSTPVASTRSVDHGTVSCPLTTPSMVAQRQPWNRVPTKLANFCDNKGHVVGEGSVPPGSNAVEDCPLHFRQCQPRRFVNQVFQTLHAEHVIETVKNLDESIRVEN